jgi:hypothetical protein
MKKCVAGVGLSLAVVLPVSGTLPTASAGVRPPIVKACGTIHAKGHKQRVDITESHGHVSHSCSAARAVMRRFLRRAPATYTGPNSAQVNFRGKAFSCYVSRPDGEGWNYHCNWFSSNADSLIDYGAGRRF